jgi:hypothetical protein
MYDNPVFKQEAEDEDSPPPTYSSRRKSILPTSPPMIVLNEGCEDDDVQHPDMAQLEEHYQSTERSENTTVTNRVKRP